MLWPKHNCIRDLYTMNKSIVSTMAWRIIKNQNSLFTKILKAKYFRNSSIWKAGVHVPIFAFSSRILKILPLTCKAIQTQIPNVTTCNWTSL